MRETPNNRANKLSATEIGFSYHTGVRDARGLMTDLEFIDVDPSFARLVGVERDRIVGCRARAILPQPFQAAPDWLTAFANEESDRRFRSSWIEVPGEGGTFLILTCRGAPDRTDHFFSFLFKAADEKSLLYTLEKREERWRYALEGGEVGVWDVNDETGEAYYSPIWKSMLGYEDHEIGNRNEDWESRIHPEDRESVFLEIREERAQRSPISKHEHRLRCKDGSYKWILSLGKSIERAPDGRSLRSVGVHIDIGERKRIEESLKQREQELRVILETTKDGFYTTDKNGQFLSANEAFLHMVGYTLKELLALRFADLSAFQTEEEINARNQRIETNGFEVFETRLRLKNKKSAFFEISASFLTHSQKIICFCRDTTERHTMEEQLRLAKQQAEEANQAKTRFLSTMSHELRNPLNSILGFTELLFDSSLTQEQRKFTQYISSSSRLLLDIIGEVLDISKIEAGKMDLAPLPNDLRKVCAEIVQLNLLRAKEKGIELRMKFDERLPESMVFDALRLRQVLMNLIGNAVKFTSVGGVSLRVALKDPKRQDGKQFVQFEIEDSGIGMTEEARRRVFSEYEQADSTISRQYGGTGLGLSISKRILNLMEASLQVKSIPGVGSVFSFAIPLIIPEVRPKKEADAKASKKPTFESDLKKKIHVLLVEDEPVNLFLAKKLLEKVSPDIGIDQATNGEEALENFLRAQPDIIFMDIHMPILDGYQTTAKIRHFEETIGGRVPIIGVTAITGKQQIEECYSSGMDDVLLKPLSAVAFEEVLRKWIHP